MTGMIMPNPVAKIKMAEINMSVCHVLVFIPFSINQSNA
jgi:hypothetical protein